MKRYEYELTYNDRGNPRFVIFDRKNQRVEIASTPDRDVAEKIVAALNRPE